MHPISVNRGSSIIKLTLLLLFEWFKLFLNVTYHEAKYTILYYTTHDIISNQNLPDFPKASGVDRVHIYTFLERFACLITSLFEYPSQSPHSALENCFGFVVDT